MSGFTGAGVSSITADDASIVVNTSTGPANIETGTLDAIATAQPPVAPVAINGQNITGVATLAANGVDTSAGAAVTSPVVSSGVAFTPSATTNSSVTVQFAGATGSYSITYGPATGAENTIASAVPTLLNAGDLVTFMVPKGWKVVVTLTTVTITQTRVTSF